MKAAVFAIAAALAVPVSPVLAQSTGMKDLEMKADMKGMDMSKADASPGTHRAVGIVKRVDRPAGTVTLAHEPVKSLNWPAMNMAFKVRDRAMLERFAEGKRVQVEFQERGKDHVITSVK